MIADCYSGGSRTPPASEKGPKPSSGDADTLKSPAAGPRKGGIVFSDVDGGGCESYMWVGVGVCYKKSILI